MSQAVIVVNRRAGAGAERVDTLAGRLATRLSAEGSTPSSIVFDTSKQAPRSWPQRLQAALAAGGERVFVLGGDGTVLAVASRLLGRPIPLGVIPLGTANLLARDLGIPLQPEAAIDLLTKHPRVGTIDVGEVNGQPFLCASMIGLTTALARTREAVRGRGPLPAAFRFARKALLLLWRYPYHRMRIRIDEQRLKVETRALIITNNPIRSVVRPNPSRERLDSGLLGLYGVRQGPLWDLPRLALRLIQGDWSQDPRIFHQQAPALCIETRHERELTVMNDGERVRLKTPLHYAIRPLALRVLQPDATSEHSATDRP
jgi:diacylglycerol kinase family enzyme